MGKKRNGNKMFISSTEWKQDYGGYRNKPGINDGDFKRLPFSCCSLSFLPFEHPVCTLSGVIYELTNIVPWIRKHGTDPATGEPITLSQITRLNFTRADDNESGDFICPVTFKTFNDHSHIVAIKTTGNVYSYDAVDRLCLKLKNFKDLISEASFTKSDIITLQDPHDVGNKSINSYHFIKNNIKPELSIDSAAEIIIKAKDEANTTSNRILAEIRKKDTLDIARDTTPSYIHKPKPGIDQHSAHYSSNTASMSFTSSGVDLQTVNEAVKFSKEEYMFTHMPKNKKAYSQIQTNVGNINIELYCSETPRTCYNFIMLAKSAFYKGCKFHRSIKNFMIQTGDPSGTGNGGKSFYEKEFADEFSSRLTHSTRGILSMANHGPNTNSSQFFITYRECRHLDRKHTVFGKIVGGQDVLDACERVETDAKDVPMLDLWVIDVIIFDDPFEEFEKDQERRVSRSEQLHAKESGQFAKRIRGDAEDTAGESVGKYLQRGDNDTQKPVVASASIVDAMDQAYALEQEQLKKRVKKPSSGFGDFSSW